MLTSTKAIFALAVSGAVALGCGSDPKPVMTPEAGKSTDATRPKASLKDDMKTPTSGSIQIDDEIIKLCGNIPTAHFAFDSAAIGEIGRAHV